MPEVEWREGTRADLLAIVDYISDHNPDAAQQLKDDIEAKVAKLPEYPRMYRAGRIEGTREMLVRANYIIVVFGAIAHFERRLISERTKDGIAAARVKGKLPGRIGRSSIYREMRRLGMERPA